MPEPDEAFWQRRVPPFPAGAPESASALELGSYAVPCPLSGIVNSAEVASPLPFVSEKNENVALIGLLSWTCGCAIETRVPLMVQSL